MLISSSSTEMGNRLTLGSKFPLRLPTGTPSALCGRSQSASTFNNQLFYPQCNNTNNTDKSSVAFLCLENFSMRHSITLQTFPHSHQTTRSIHSLQAQRQGNQLLSQGETLASPCIGVLRFQKGPLSTRVTCTAPVPSSERLNVQSYCQVKVQTSSSTTNPLQQCIIRVKSQIRSIPYSQVITMHMCPESCEKKRRMALMTRAMSASFVELTQTKAQTPNSKSPIMQVHFNQTRSTMITTQRQNSQAPVHALIEPPSSLPSFARWFRVQPSPM